MRLRLPIAAMLVPLALGTAVATHVLPLPSGDASAVAAEPGEPSAAVAARLMPAAPAQGRAWIEGTVVDRAGRLLDEVDVAAYRVGDRASGPVASWQTYEDPVGGPHHGWYRMWGLTPGTYQLRFSSSPDAPRRASFRTRWSAPVSVRSRDVVRLGATALTLTRRVTGRLGASFADRTVRPSAQARLRVSLTSADVRPVVGRVRVQVDRQRPRTVALRPADRGRVIVTLPRQRPGVHRVSVTFLGNDAVAASTAPYVATYRVTRTGR